MGANGSPEQRPRLDCSGVKIGPSDQLVRPIAERLDRGASAAAQGHRRTVPLYRGPVDAEQDEVATHHEGSVRVRNHGDVGHALGVPEHPPPYTRSAR